MLCDACVLAVGGGFVVSGGGVGGWVGRWVGGWVGGCTCIHTLFAILSQ